MLVAAAALLLQHLAHPSAVAPAKQGPDVGWTTGLMADVQEQATSDEPVSFVDYCLEA